MRDSYEHLWTSVGASLAWVGLAVTLALGGTRLAAVLSPFGLASILLEIACVAVSFCLVVGPLTGGLFRFARNACASDEPEPLDLLWGFRSMLGRCVALAAIQLLVSGVLAADSLFFITRGWLPLVALGAVFGYLFFYWQLAMLYQWPLLVEQERGVLDVVKKSALLELDNFAPTAVVGIIWALLTVVAWAFVLPAVLLWPALVAFLQTRALREVLPRYGLMPVELPPAAGDDAAPWRPGWHE